MDGRKRYRFTVRWGEERDTDDSEGRVTATSDERRPTAERDPRRFCRASPGAIQQVPPHYSAIKIEGERAYDLARDGETVELEARAGRYPRVWRLWNSRIAGSRGVRGRMRQGHLCPLAGPRHGPDCSAVCGHVSAPAPRTLVGPFTEKRHDFTGRTGGFVP